jgi:hypothetical protein
MKGERTLIKCCRGMLIMENYKNIYSGHGHGVWWDESYEKPPLLPPTDVKTHPAT